MVWAITTTETPQIRIVQGDSLPLFKYGKSTLDPSREYIAITESPEYANSLPFHPDTFIDQIKDRIGIAVNRRILELYEIAALFKLGSFRSNDESVHVLNPLFKGPDTYVHFVTHVDMVESQVVHEVLTNLKNVKGIAVFQITGTQSQVSVQLLYWLASISETLYIYRPSVISDLYDIKYVILKGTKAPKITSKGPVASLCINIPDNVMTVIQCMNLTLMRRKIHMYDMIKDYLKTAVPTTQLTEHQEKNAKEWFKTFLEPGDLDIVTCDLKSVYDLDY